MKYKNRNSKMKTTIGGTFLLVLFAFIFFHNGKFYIFDFLVVCLIGLSLSALGAFITFALMKKANMKYVPSKISISIILQSNPLKDNSFLMGLIKVKLILMDRIFVQCII